MCICFPKFVHERIFNFQGLARSNQALKVRLLQSCGAHMAMCHGGEQLQTLSWPQLQNIFRSVGRHAYRVEFQRFLCDPMLSISHVH